jgi:hypothetical protein
MGFTAPYRSHGKSRTAAHIGAVCPFSSGGSTQTIDGFAQSLRTTTSQFWSISEERPDAPPGPPVRDEITGGSYSVADNLLRILEPNLVALSSKWLTYEWMISGERLIPHEPRIPGHVELLFAWFPSPLHFSLAHVGLRCPRQGTRAVLCSQVLDAVIMCLAAEPRSSVRLLCQRDPRVRSTEPDRVHLREPPHPKPRRSPFSACHCR